MSPTQTDRELDFSFEVSGLSADTFVVTRFSGTEGMSELFRFDVDLASRDPLVSFDDVVGQDVLLIMNADGGPRFVHGMVCQFELLRSGARFTEYRARVVPRIWRLGLRRRNRVFQNKTVPEVVQQVLDDNHIPGDFYDPAITKSYETREFLIQYRETDLNLILRILEEEGIGFHFRHTEEAHVLVTVDDTGSLEEIGGSTSTIRYRAEDIGGFTGHEILDFGQVQRMQPDTVTLREYERKRPGVEVTSTTEASSTSGLEIYEYPGFYRAMVDGDDSFPVAVARRLSRTRLEEYVSRSVAGAGTSNARHMTAGHKFSLAEHPRADLNRDLLLIHVEHTGEQRQVLGEDAGAGSETPMYRNRFVCIPADTLFHPPRLTPVPRADGPETAKVVGPSGEEIYVDEHGRIKIQFHWDLEGEDDEHSSCWVPLNQRWAGPGHGHVWVPRVGWEVIVDFLDGDPNRPVVTGGLYNGENPHPYPLPDEKTKSGLKTASTPGGDGYNELIFDDAAGNEQISIHAQKNMDTVVEDSRTATVKTGTCTTTVKGDTTLTVQAGKRSVDVTGGDYSAVSNDAAVKLHGKGDGVTIQGDASGVSIKGNGQGVTIEGNGGTGVGISGTPNFEASGASTATVQAPTVNVLGDGSVTIQAPSITIQAGGSSIVMDGGSISINSPTITVSGASVTVDGSGSLNLHGGVLNAAADGVASLTGAMVKNN